MCFEDDNNKYKRIFFHYREKTAYILRENGYSPDIFFDFSVGQDLVNSTWRTIYLDQAGLGLSREYLIKGMENERVQHYFEYMKTVSAYSSVKKVFPKAANFRL